MENSPNSSYECHIPDESVLEPLRYLRDGPAGKELRTILIDCFQARKIMVSYCFSGFNGYIECLS